MCVRPSVAPHHFDKDPDPSCHFDADPDPACHFDADPDPTVNFDVDPDPDPRFQKKAQNLEKVLIFNTFWLAICKFMRIRIQLITMMRIRIPPFNLMRIRIHNTGQDNASFPFNKKENNAIFTHRRIF
jgi:hypothetical protein